MEIQTHVLQDVAGESHIVEILEHVLLVDNQEVTILSCEQEIQLSNSTGIIRCSAEQFWHSLVGADPTPAEAGSLLAQCLAFSLAFQRIRQVEASVPPLILPSYRLSPFVMQLLATLDGTPEQTSAVARILRVSVETVLFWAEQHCLPAGKPVKAEASHCARTGTALDIDRGATHTKRALARDQRESVHESVLAAGGSNGNERQFRWSGKRVLALTRFVQSLSTQDLEAQSTAAANHFGWPRASVRAKLSFIQSQLARIEGLEMRASAQVQAHMREPADSPAPEDERVEGRYREGHPGDGSPGLPA